jgi:hypothetical protein
VVDRVEGPRSHPVTDPLEIDPDGMMTVTFADPSSGVTRTLNAIVCHYVSRLCSHPWEPASRVVLAEVLHDPTTPTPKGVYFAEPSTLESILLPAHALRLVSPYVTVVGP